MPLSPTTVRLTSAVRANALLAARQATAVQTTSRRRSWLLKGPPSMYRRTNARKREKMLTNTQQSEARVEEIAQAIAQHIEPQNGKCHGQTGPQRQLGILENVRLRVAQHAAPGRNGRLGT